MSLSLYDITPEWPETSAPHDNSSRPSTVAEAIARHHRVRHFRGGHDKNEAFSNRGEAMARFPFIQLNPADFLNFLVVDVDREDAELWLLHPAVPEPHWIIQNPANGHAQAGWMIDPVRRGPDAREHPIRYAESVQAALDQLTGSDSNFTRFLVRNPVADSPAGIVRFGSRIEPYTLGDLMSHMQNYEDPFDPDFSAWTGSTTKLRSAGRVRARAATGGRNNALFYATRAELWKRFTEQSISPTKDYALDYAHAMNEQLPTPLPHREIRELAASAVRQVLKGQGKGLSSAPDPWLAEMGRKGGSASTESKRTAAEINARKATESRQQKKEAREAQARRLRAKGHTVEAIAGVLGKCVRTIKRYLAAAASKGDISQATGSPGVSGSRPHPELAACSKLQRHPWTSPTTCACPCPTPSEKSPTPIWDSAQHGPAPGTPSHQCGSSPPEAYVYPSPTMTPAQTKSPAPPPQSMSHRAERTTRVDRLPWWPPKFHP